MLKKDTAITLEEIYAKLLPVSFWEEVAALFPHIVTSKLYPFKSPGAVLPFLERFKEYKKELELFLNSLEAQLPAKSRDSFNSAVQSTMKLHLEKFIEKLSIQCQDNLRAYFQMQYMLDPSHEGQQLSHLNLTSFLAKNKIAIIEFFADWCTPCKSIIPHINKVITLYKGKVAVGKVDLDRYPNLAKPYNVVSIPTLIFFKENQPVKKLVGLHTFEDMSMVVQKLLKNTI